MPCDSIPSKLITLTSSRFGPIHIRAPNFGNKDDYNRTRVNRRSRGNELLIGGPDYWPTNRAITYTFDTLSIHEVQQLNMLVSQSIGLPITIIDHENITLDAIITNPSPEIKATGRGECNYATTLEFMLIS